MINDPIISTSIPVPEGLDPHDTADYISEAFKYSIDVLVYSDMEPPEESTIIDCTGEEIEVVREGKTIIH
ncbi:MAG: Sua5/YciO/YrdC/YwlC family protein [Saprospiraceae bacterium]|nr:Sua5/YciO/YrdC/YwlC family protein [Saprospiraceae bacterium]